MVQFLTALPRLLLPRRSLGSAVKNCWLVRKLLYTWTLKFLYSHNISLI